jgi:threonine dehydratase
VAREVVDEVILVSTDETCAAIKDAFEDTRSIIEPAGALAIAGLKKYVAKYPSPHTNRELVAITSGANMDFDRLRFVAERAALGERKEALLSVNIPETPGAFSKLVEVILPHAVTAFSYRYANDKSADVLMGISLSASTGRDDLAKIMAELVRGGMSPRDLSDDELAKRHVRFLVGGRSDVTDERLFMFEFPERPGALAKFLTTLRPNQNISLFHYRNYGGDVGKVLAGIQCPESEKADLEAFLHDLAYPFSEETESETYKTFLRH